MGKRGEERARVALYVREREKRERGGRVSAYVLVRKKRRGVRVC